MRKVTIMIPTYNQSQYIEQCIKSAMYQDYPNLEIIISDDSTNDKTAHIVKEKFIDDPRIKYYHNKPRLGRVVNYHHTLYEKATGDFVLNLDGDDWLIDNSYITKAVKMLESDNEIVCVIARIMYFHEDKNHLEEGPGYDELASVDYGDKFLYLNAYGKAPINHLTVLYRKDYAKKIGFYNKDTVWSDTESIFRLMCHNKVGFINEYAGVWRIHSSNESKSFYKSTKIEELFLLEESVAAYCKKDLTTHSFNYLKWMNQWKYVHSLEFIVFSLKDSQFNRLFKFVNFLLTSHKLFLIRVFPKLLFNVSQRASTYLVRKIF